MVPLPKQSELAAEENNNDIDITNGADPEMDHLGDGKQKDTVVKDDNDNDAVATASPSPSIEERWAVENIDVVCQLWSLSEDKRNELIEIKDKLADIEHFKNDPFEVVRFLTGPNGFEESAFRDMIEWRLEKNVDSLMQEYEVPPLLEKYVPSAVLKGCDKDGDPIYLERAGVMDGVGLLNAFDQDVLIRHITWLREKAVYGDWIEDYKKEHDGKPPKQVTIVYDLEGLSYSHMKPEILSLFQEIIQITTSKYIGLAKRMIIIRAPTVFHMIWRVAQYFFRESALERMVFSGPYDYREILEQYIDLEVLPSCIVEEGKGEIVQGMPSSMEGGTLPLDS